MPVNTPVDELDEEVVDNYSDDDFDGDDIDIEDVDGFGDIFVAGMAEALEAANAPALAEGEYLARVVAITPKINTTKSPNSFGLNVALVINKNPNAVKEGWQQDDRTFELKSNYVYVGTIANSKVSFGNSIFSYSALHKALGLTETDPLAGRRDTGKVIRVKTFLEADSREAAPEPGVPDDRQKYVKIKTHMPYRNAAGDVAPRLSFSDDE